MADERYRVILLPGGVLPAAPAYGSLLEALEGRVDAVLKDLEVYARDEPPAGFGLETEVEAIGAAGDEHGFGRFHLVGYSAGGACAVAFAAAHGERLASLALLEPAWAGNERTAEEDALHERMREAGTRPPAEFMQAFVRLQLAAGVDPPPPPDGPPPPWMQRRPAGLRALMAAFDRAELDLAALRGFERPVLFVLGGRSNPDYFARMADRLSAVFPDFTVETFAARHHFDPPHRIEPDRLADTLLKHWRRAERAH